MTRSDVHNIVAGKLQESLIDTSTIKEGIGKAYEAWFQQKLQQGLQMTAPTPPPDQSAPPGGAQ